MTNCNTLHTFTQRELLLLTKRPQEVVQILAPEARADAKEVPLVALTRRKLLNGLIAFRDQRVLFTGVPLIPLIMLKVWQTCQRFHTSLTSIVFDHHHQATKIIEMCVFFIVLHEQLGLISMTCTNYWWVEFRWERSHIICHARIIPNRAL